MKSKTLTHFVQKVINYDHIFYSAQKNYVVFIMFNNKCNFVIISVYNS